MSNTSLETLSAISTRTVWPGPAKLLGQDGQQVLIKNRSSYIRVNPCCHQFINQNSENNQDAIAPPCISNENDKHDPQPHSKISKNQFHQNIENSDSEDEDPNTRKSRNYHSLNQTSNHEIQGQVYHEDIHSKLKKLNPKTKIKYKIN